MCVTMSSSPPRERLFAAFADSRVGYHLRETAASVFSFGTLRRLERDEPLPAYGPGSVHVLLEGRLAAADGLWHGPGNHFAAGTQRLVALEASTWIWTFSSASEMREGLPTELGVWRSDVIGGIRRAWDDAVHAALSDELKARPPVPLPDPTELCDYDHPSILSLSRRFARDTPAATAQAIFYAIQVMPYRFGLWQEKASQTLARGTGMCTTKANLQVALFRALGLEAGFVTIPLDMSVLGGAMPDAWRQLMRVQVRHFFAAVALSGRWHPADASFCPASCKLISDAHPHLRKFIPPWFEEGRPYHPVALIQGTDPFDIQVMPEINAEMGKKSRFLPRHFEAMNTQLDRLWRDTLRPHTPAIAAPEVYAFEGHDG